MGSHAIVRNNTQQSHPLPRPSWASQVAQWRKNPSANAGDTASIPGSEAPLEEGWQLSPAFLPGKSHGQRSLVGYSPRGHKESDLATNKMISLGKTKSCIPAVALQLHLLVWQASPVGTARGTCEVGEPHGPHEMCGVAGFLVWCSRASRGLESTGTQLRKVLVRY